MSTISKNDIQVGDTIRMTREVKVDAVWNHAVKASDGGLYGTSNVTIELIDRPLPPLPIKPGSVIRVSQGFITATWILGVNDMWLSHTGAQQAAERFHSLIKARGWDVEVLA